MKKIGLLFGSFNPVHIGHLLVAEEFRQTTEMDETWLVVSPQNPFKDDGSLIPEEHRLAMVKLAVHENSNLHACDVEFSLPRPSYTIDTLNTLSRLFPGNAFTLLLGQDLLPSLPAWKDVHSILSNYPVFTYPRGCETHDMPVELAMYSVVALDLPRLEISSTRIRSLLKAQRSIRYLVPEKVARYIAEHGLYKPEE